MLETVIAELETNGLLLKTDAKLPNVCALVAGEPVRGSWWSHTMSHQMFHVLTEVASHRDVLTAKLISSKDTFVHRSLWPAFLAVAMSRERWQFAALDAKARALLKRVDEQGKTEASGGAAVALEKALLVHGEQMHTSEGSHAKVLTSWGKWMESAAVQSPELTAAQGRESIEKAVSFLNRRHDGRGRLPWPAARTLTTP
jgi:hypothetical protein